MGVGFPASYASVSPHMTAWCPGIPVCEAVVGSNPRGQSPAPSHLASARPRLLLLFEGGFHWSEVRQRGLLENNLRRCQLGTRRKLGRVCQGARWLKGLCVCSYFKFHVCMIICFEGKKDMIGARSCPCNLPRAGFPLPGRGTGPWLSVTYRTSQARPGAHLSWIFCLILTV